MNYQYSHDTTRNGTLPTIIKLHNLLRSGSKWSLSPASTIPVGDVATGGTSYCSIRRNTATMSVKFEVSLTNRGYFYLFAVLQYKNSGKVNLGNSSWEVLRKLTLDSAAHLPTLPKHHLP